MSNSSNSSGFSPLLWFLIFWLLVIVPSMDRNDTSSNLNANEAANVSSEAQVTDSATPAASPSPVPTDPRVIAFVNFLTDKGHAKRFVKYDTPGPLGTPNSVQAVFWMPGHRRVVAYYSGAKTAKDWLSFSVYRGKHGISFVDAGFDGKVDSGLSDNLKDNSAKERKRSKYFSVPGEQGQPLGAGGAKFRPLYQTQYNKVLAFVSRKFHS